MYSFTTRDLIKKSSYQVENTAEQHYRLLNTLKLIDHDGYLYCFCQKYFGPQEEFGSAPCHLCLISNFLTIILNFWIEINLILGNWVFISLDYLVF